MRKPRLIPDRRFDAELMDDAPGLDPAEVADAYRVLSRINRQFFGGRRVLRSELRRCLAEDRPGRRLTLLDLGSGSGDLPQDVASSSFRSIALDRDPTAVRLAHESGLEVVLGDALRLPIADQSVDIASAVKFAHHFAGDGLRRLLSEMARVARFRVLVLDIRRDWLAYAGFVAWSHVFTRNRLVRHDGALSVLRGFTDAELLDAASGLVGFDWSVRRHAGFQLALVGHRRQPILDS